MEFQDQTPPEEPTNTVPVVGKPYGNPIIKVIGIGGGGSNAVSRMFNEKLAGVEYFAVNTDAQHLARVDVPNKIAIGQSLTRGLGVGGNPDIGRQAAEESREELEQAIAKIRGRR